MSPDPPVSITFLVPKPRNAQLPKPCAVRGLLHLTERLRRTRGGLRAFLIRTPSQLTETFGALQPIRRRRWAALEYLATKHHLLCDLDQRELQNSAKDQLESEVASALEYEKNPQETITHGRRFLRPHTNDERPVDQSQSDVSGVRGVAVPKVPIPIFSGKLQEWQRFWDT